MIDLHTHILPRIDDGAGSSQESLTMLSDSYSQGISICVATPHITPHDEEMIDSFIIKRDVSAEKIKNKLSQADIIAPKLLLGSEILLDNDISEFKNLEKLCIENTNLMLIELPTAFYSKSFPEWLYSLSVKGFGLILAHIERYSFLSKLVYELEGTDVTYQINASTLLTFSGRRFLRDFCEEENNIVISSDAHNTTYRKNHMLDAYKKIEKRSKMFADDIFENNAAKLLSNNKK